MFVCEATDLQDWGDFLLAIVNAVLEDENRTCFFPSIFSFSAFPFVRLFTSAKTACPIFFVNKKQNFFERQYLYPQDNVRENTGRVHEILHPTCWWSAKLAQKNCSTLTGEYTKKLSITDSLNNNSHLHPRRTLRQHWFILLLFGNLKSSLLCLQVTLLPLRCWRMDCGRWLSWDL